MKKSTVIGKTEITINAPIDAVWKVLAEEFSDIGDWSSGVDVSEGSGEGVNGSKYSERACQISAVGFSDTKERILQYERNNLIRYSLYEGLPGFVANAENTWTFFEDGEHTHVVGQTVMQVKGVMGCLFRSLMKHNLNKALASMAEESKHYIETGYPHPKKVRAKAKFAKKQARKRVAA